MCLIISIIKDRLKHIISIVIITTLLLPFAVQFVHSIEKHEHLVCTSQNKIHFDSHEIDCSVFHFKINTNTVDFNSNLTVYIRNLSTDKVYTIENKKSSVKLYYKSSRAPPFLLT